MCTGCSRDRGQNEYGFGTGRYCLEYGPGSGYLSTWQNGCNNHLLKSGPKSTCESGYYGRNGKIITCEMIEIYLCLAASKIGDYSNG